MTDAGKSPVAAYSTVFPWQWTAAHPDDWFSDLRAVHHCTRSTVRGYQVAVRGFCAFVTDPAYGWAEECLARFGTHPVQVAPTSPSGADPCPPGRASSG